MSVGKCTESDVHSPIALDAVPGERAVRFVENTVFGAGVVHRFAPQPGLSCHGLGCRPGGIDPLPRVRHLGRRCCLEESLVTCELVIALVRWGVWDVPGVTDLGDGLLSCRLLSCRFFGVRFLGEITV